MHSISCIWDNQSCSACDYEKRTQPCNATCQSDRSSRRLITPWTQVLAIVRNPDLMTLPIFCACLKDCLTRQCASSKSSPSLCSSIGPPGDMGGYEVQRRVTDALFIDEDHKPCTEQNLLRAFTVFPVVRSNTPSRPPISFSVSKK